MRDQGRLVEWFDDKGYGFIQPNETNKERVFLHIKDFARPGPRPIVGCALEYMVLLDGQGRFRAQQVTYLKASQTGQKPKAKPTPPQKHSVMQLAGMAYFVALAVLVIAGLLAPREAFVVEKQKRIRQIAERYFKTLNEPD